MDRHVFFNEGNIWVTGNSFTSGSDTYLIASIHGVSVIQNKQLPLLSLFGLLTGAALLVWFPITGVSLIAASLVFGFRQRAVHFLQLNVDGREVRALTSRNVEYLQTVQGAIGKAMIFRDSPPTLPTNFQDA